MHLHDRNTNVCLCVCVFLGPNRHRTKINEIANVNGADIQMYTHTQITRYTRRQQQQQQQQLLWISEKNNVTTKTVQFDDTRKKNNKNSQPILHSKCFYLTDLWTFVGGINVQPFVCQNGLMGFYTIASFFRLYAYCRVVMPGLWAARKFRCVPIVIFHFLFGVRIRSKQFSNTIGCVASGRRTAWVNSSSLSSVRPKGRNQIKWKCTLPYMRTTAIDSDHLLKIRHFTAVVTTSKRTRHAHT